MPLPAELRDLVEPDFLARKNLAGKARLAVLKAPERPPEVKSPIRREEVDAILARYRTPRSEAQNKS